MIGFATALRREFYRLLAAERGWRVCKLSATWRGPLPALGDYVMAPRGRFGYRIFDIDVTRMMEGTARATLHVLRMPRADVEADATIHDWTWDRR